MKIYLAHLELGRGTYARCGHTNMKYFYDLEHVLMIDDQGNVSEPFYINHPCKAVNIFKKPRVWGAEAVKGYRMVEITAERMKQLKGSY